jgi:hypothetical protein
MGATVWLVFWYLRRRWAALVPLALVVALGGAGALVAVGAADRTAGAYSDYLVRADVGDVLVNPSLNTADIDRVVRGLPGVRSVSSSSLFFAGIGEGTSMPRGELEEGDNVQGMVYGSVDGRFEAMDRPVLAGGRMPTGPDEVLVNVEVADAEGLEVGDTLPLTFWRSRDDLAAASEDVITPLGVEHPTVVGIATMPDEVLPDRLFPRGRVIVSPELARRYDCLPGAPPGDASYERAIEQVYPDDCSTSYRYYSLDVAGGAGAVAPLLDVFLDRAGDANAALPAAWLEDSESSPSYYLVAITTADERDRVERSTRPIVTALGLLGVAAGAVTAVVLGLGVAREIRRTDDNRRQWWRLGLTGGRQAVVIGVPLLLAVAAGVVAALVLAWFLSPIGPVGSVRSVEPSPGRELSVWVQVAALALAAVCGFGVAALAAQAAGRTGRREGGRSSVATRPRRLWTPRRPDVDQGLHAAYGGSRGHLLVVSCGLAAGTFLTAAVFGASLSALLSTSASYGWPWDLAVMTGFGYGDLDRAAVARALDGHPDVATWTELGFTNEISLDGESLPTVVAPTLRSGIDLAVVEGRLPLGTHEVALGARTAADRGLGPGDDVSLSGGGIESRRMTVTGIAVLPPLGAFQSDRSGPGTGMVLPVAVHPEAAGLITFAGIDLAPDADPAAVFAELHDDMLTWDTLGAPPIEYRAPVRPAEIINVQSMRAVPLLVGGLLTGTAIVGLTVAVALSVRSRRRELAILQALGFTQRQVRTTVRVQALATMAAGLITGVPLGIAVGRVTWRAFATQLGVVDDPSTPAWWIAATITGSLLIALAAAAVPVRVAARIRPATALRTE